ncbi:MAG TPA: PilN domain-containing protein [Myxococcales bacterium]|nr:PilN domain-containing protein [Myxococcales bacterium]
MIRINLLPVRAAKKREFGRQQLILFALILVGAGVGNYIWWKAENDNLTALNSRIVSTRNEIAQLEKTIGEVKTITEEKKALEGKLKILDALKKARTGPVKLMDELATVIPNKVWLAEYTEQNQNLILHGSAVTYEDLSAFAQKLKTSKYFSNVSIKKASQKDSSGVVEWEIACTANYSA